MFCYSELPVQITMANIICHNFFERFPNIHMASVENGAVANVRFLDRSQCPEMLRFSDAGPPREIGPAEGPASEGLQGRKPRSAAWASVQRVGVMGVSSGA